MDIITTQQLRLFYGEFEALKGIDMNIPEHEITAFIGPSGCGKSTFLKTLNRMNDLVAGAALKERYYIGTRIFTIKKWT